MSQIIDLGNICHWHQGSDVSLSLGKGYGYPGHTCRTVCKTNDVWHWEATAVGSWPLEYCWEVLSGVCHQSYAASLLLKTVVVCCHSFREESPVKLVLPFPESCPVVHMVHNGVVSLDQPACCPWLRPPMWLYTLITTQTTEHRV